MLLDFIQRHIQLQHIHARFAQHISPAAAKFQAARVAKARGLSVDKVNEAVARFTENRQCAISTAHVPFALTSTNVHYSYAHKRQIRLRCAIVKRVSEWGRQSNVPRETLADDVLWYRVQEACRFISTLVNPYNAYRKVPCFGANPGAVDYCNMILHCALRCWLYRNPKSGTSFNVCGGCQIAGRINRVPTACFSAKERNS